jgi:hypothetical protein
MGSHPRIRRVAYISSSKESDHCSSVKKTFSKAIKDKIEENETHVVVIIAVPSDPRKRPKKPATEGSARTKVYNNEM